jgi:hypothetical protein|tara:strand:- start:1131 stop:1814 length:684 start_codon:yes stop_codon:yes gene_type:complete
MAATFDARLVDLIGDYAAKINDNHEIDLLNAAIAEVADSVPPELLLKYAVTPILLDNGTPTWTSVEGKKILLVTRLDGDGVDRNCEMVGIPMFSQAKDTDSVYEATSYSPVACHTTTGGASSLELYPVPTASETAKVYYFTYPVTNQKERTDNQLNAAGIPFQLLHAIALRTAITMLQAYISDSIQDDEDAEITTMLGQQVISLSTQYGAEMQRFTIAGTFTQGEAE